MTLLQHAHGLAPGWSRLKRRPETVAALAGIGAFLLQLIAGRPGWMVPATVGQWTQARSGPYNDAYPAVLTWLWAQMDPAGRGPLVPFMLQTFLFWLGVVMLTVGMQPAARWTRFLPLLALINPLTWVVVVVSPYAAMLALISASVGLASIGFRLFRSGRPTNGTVALLTASAVLGSAGMSGGILTIFVVPLLLLLTAALALAVLPHHLPARWRLETGAKALVLTGVAAVAAAVALPLVVIGNLAPTRTSEAFYALDAFHVDCAETWSTGRIATDPVSPQGLWADASAPCSTGTPGDFGDAWAGSADPASAQVLSVGAWVGIALHHPGIVIGGRLQHAAAMLATDYPLIPDITGGKLVSAPAAVGSGNVAGQPNRGGVLLSAAAAVTAILPGAPLLWTLLIPGGVAVWLVRRRQPTGRAGHPVIVLPVLLWPPLAALVLGMATPFNDATAIAPAAVLGWVFSLWAVGTAGVRVEARDAEGIRYGGPYPGAVKVPAVAEPAAAATEDVAVRRRFALVRSLRLPSLPLPNLAGLRRRRDPFADFDSKTQHPQSSDAELHEELREKVPHG